MLALHAIEMDGDRPRLREQTKRRLSEQPLRAVALDPANGSVAAAGADNTIYVLPLAQLGDAEPRVMPCGERGVLPWLSPATADRRRLRRRFDPDLLPGRRHRRENRSGDAAHQGPVRSLLFRATLNDEQGRPYPPVVLARRGRRTQKVWTLDQRRKPHRPHRPQRQRALALFEPCRKTNRNSAAACWSR